MIADLNVHWDMAEDGSLHTTKTVGLPHARGLGELYDGVA
jgi:hypothetical protein